MRLLVVGAGGHAKVVIDAAQSAGVEIAAVLGVPSGATQVLGVPVTHAADGIVADAFICAVGDNAQRRSAFEEQLRTGVPAAVIIHPSASVARSSAIGEGAFVAAGAVINPEARIGRNVIVNTGATVDHDCRIEDHVHIGPGAHLCGGVQVGEGALIGVSASAAPGVSIGARCVVGAGAAVVSDLPADTVWAGVPARLLRRIEG